MKTKEEYVKLTKLLRQTPSINQFDTNFKRMMYVRYADDFVILIAGDINDAQKVKLYSKEYLASQCGSELNDEKTIVTNIR